MTLALTANGLRVRTIEWLQTNCVTKNVKQTTYISLKHAQSKLIQCAAVEGDRDRHEEYTKEG